MHVLDPFAHATGPKFGPSTDGTTLPALIRPAVTRPIATRPTVTRSAVTVRVLVLDSHHIVRRGISALLSEHDRVSVVAEASTLLAARAQILAAGPAVVLLETHLPDGNGIDFCRDLQLSAPDVRCLFFTSDLAHSSMSAAFAAGAAGYLLKDAPGQTLVEAIRRVAAGKSLSLPSGLDLPPARPLPVPPPDHRLATLTPRERDILTLVADGLSNRQISHRLSLSEKTVKNYVSHLFAKLGVQRRTQAATYGAQLLLSHGPLRAR